MDAKVLDGSVIAHMLHPGTCTTFADYAEQVFKPYILSQLESVQRLDIVWDIYREDSLKLGARENRGKGTRRRVESRTKIPGNWQSFLRVNENKTELFAFLCKHAVQTVLENGKEIYSTNGEDVLVSGAGNVTTDLAQCTHEEADTRIMLHVADQLKQGHSKIQIRTVDTDVVILAVATVQQLSPDLEELWIAFGNSKNYRYLSAHDMCTVLGPEKSRSLPLFHAFTGCDTVSAFAGKGKKSAWESWNVFPELTDALRAIHQGVHCWGQSLSPCPVLPDPHGWGWQKDASGWRPVWTFLPAAMQTCYELIHCSCKKGCKNRCKCKKASLSCTALCLCDADCNQQV